MKSAREAMGHGGELAEWCGTNTAQGADTGRKACELEQLRGDRERAGCSDPDAEVTARETGRLSKQHNRVITAEAAPGPHTRQKPTDFPSAALNSRETGAMAASVQKKCHYPRRSACCQTCLFVFNV